MSNAGAPATATLRAFTLAVGSHVITATYNGDPNNAPTTSGALTQTVVSAGVRTRAAKISSMQITAPFSIEIMAARTHEMLAA